MNRLEFMSELEKLLSDISENEREEALNYYNDYLDDGGVENEEEVIRSLGSPKEVAATIKAGLFSGDEGAFKECGYQDYEEPNKKTVAVRTEEERREESDGEEKKQDFRQQADAETDRGDGQRHHPMPRKKKGSWSVGLILLCILFSPFLLVGAGGAAVLIIGIAAVIFGLAISAAVLIFSLFIAAAAFALALLVTGVVLIGIGIGKLFISPLGGLTLFGGGACCAGIGLLFLALTVWIAATAIPAVIRGIVNIFSRLFHRKGGAAI